MSLFSKEPKVPNTISDEQMADLQRRGRKADTESMFSPRNVARRLASNEQRDKAKQN